MEKINFQDFPNTETPVDADNLNSLQDNVENEINLIKEYSTNEKIIGKWINGKPLYKKTISTSVDLTTTGSKSIPHGVSNLGVGVKVEYTLLNGVIWQSYNSAISALGLNSSNIVIYCNVNWQVIDPIIFTIYYTKTTD